MLSVVSQNVFVIPGVGYNTARHRSLFPPRTGQELRFSARSASPMVLMMISIRPMVSEDIPTIARWIAAIPLWQRYDYSAEAAQRGLEQALARADLLLTADVGDACACGLAWCVPRGAFGRSCYLRLLGVQSGLHSAGLGATLLGAAEREAARSADDLVLLVSDFNADAQRFYQRQGYRQVGAIPGYVLPDVTELIFWKRLVPSGAS